MNIFRSIVVLSMLVMSNGFTSSYTDEDISLTIGGDGLTASGGGAGDVFDDDLFTLYTDEDLSLSYWW